MLQWKCKVIRATGSEIVQSHAVQQFCIDRDIKLEAPSIATPESMGHCEAAVGNLIRRARAMLLGAPHLRKSLWSAAVCHSANINSVLPKKWNGGLTPYECIHLRPPDLKNLFFGIFGCPMECVHKAKPDKYPDKMAERYKSMYWLRTLDILSL